MTTPKSPFFPLVVAPPTAEDGTASENGKLDWPISGIRAGCELNNQITQDISFFLFLRVCVSVRVYGVMINHPWREGSHGIWPWDNDALCISQRRS